MGINQETRTCGCQPVNLVVFDDTGVTYLSLNHPDDFFATAANGTVGSSKQESPKAKSKLHQILLGQKVASNLCSIPRHCTG